MKENPEAEFDDEGNLMFPNGKGIGSLMLADFGKELECELFARTEDDCEYQMDWFE